MTDTINLRPGDEQKFSGMPPHFGRRSRRKKIIWGALIIIAAIVLWCIAAFVAGASAWKAVFLTNNQVYFGHFVDYPFSPTITLRDVYYLQITQPSQQLSGESQSQLKLVKLGNEIHGPTSEMVIPLGQILFWETLRSDSAIVATINQAQTVQSQSQSQTGK